MFFSKRAQVSVEIVLVIIFLIIFIIIFNDLSEHTINTLEKNKILEQEGLIADSLYGFLKQHESLMFSGSDKLSLSFENKKRIPIPLVGTKKPFCEVFITSSYISVVTYHNNQIIRHDKPVNFDFSKFDFSKTIRKPCGDVIVCSDVNSFIKCE